MNESQGLLSDPKAKTTELQNPNKMKESGLDVGAAHTQKKPNTEVNSMQGSKEMGLGSDSCKELEEVARGVNVSKEQKLTVTNMLEGEKGREPQSLKNKVELGNK